MDDGHPNNQSIPIRKRSTSSSTSSSSSSSNSSSILSVYEGDVYFKSLQSYSYSLRTSFVDHPATHAAKTTQLPKYDTAAAAIAAGAIAGAAAGGSGGSPGALDVYVLGLENTLTDFHPKAKASTTSSTVTPAPPRISGALRRCKTPFYIISTGSTKQTKSQQIGATWEFLASGFSGDSRRLFCGDKLQALRQISERVPEHARVHYIDGDAGAIEAALKDGLGDKERWRLYWANWGSEQNEDATSFLKRYDGTQAVEMELDDFVELVGTGVIMGYPYTHRNEEYKKQT
eukprot:CAMPEP_0197522390 /NCGR_PEP_ID=MMETSP1318-20131121/7555_1 /TAXON_ID=552666 /ORGANISM="Partenskyella glossopodia, Strain RCC365" /LENGTH=287 /DNA_ID=CAMNT_0043074769 /DNA_START=1 /DNA_END=865 /DNA_ORIENTATION=+